MILMKKFISFMLLCGIASAFTLSYAQSVKIKKGEVYVDGNSVAKISGQKSGPYTYSTPEGKTLFSITITDKTPKGFSAPTAWLELTSADGKTHEMEIPDKARLAISYDKIYTYYLIDGKPQLLDKNGWKSDNLAEIFNKSSREISNHWDSLYLAVQQENQQATELSQKTKIEIGPSGEVLLNGNTMGRITLRVSEEIRNPHRVYTLYDTKQNEIGRLVANGLNGCPLFSKITLFDGKTLYTQECNTSKNLSEDEAAKHMVARAIAAGYTLGDMTDFIRTMLAKQEQNAEEAKEAVKQEKIDSARSSSPNIYDTPAKILFSDGGNAQGRITLLYESIEEKAGVKQRGIIDLDTKKYGATALFIDQSGEKYTLKAKEGAIIQVGERKLIGSSAKEDGALAYINPEEVLSFFGVTDSAQFFEILYDDGHENYILQHPLEPNELLLKLKGKEGAIYVGKKGLMKERSKDKICKALQKYLSCTSVNADDYDTLTVNGLKKLMADYTQKCR